MSDESKSVVGPCVRESGMKDESEQLLSKEDAGRFRELAARAHYLAQDRPDIEYAVN